MATSSSIFITKYTTTDVDTDTDQSTESEFIITAVPYSPDIMGHHIPRRRPESDKSTSTSRYEQDSTIPYIEFTSPIPAHQTSQWDTSLLL